LNFRGQGQGQGVVVRGQGQEQGLELQGQGQEQGQKLVLEDPRVQVLSSRTTTL